MKFSYQRNWFEVVWDVLGRIFRDGWGDFVVFLDAFVLVIASFFATPALVKVWSISTTLQSLMNTKLIPHRFWPCHENRLVKTVQTIPHNLYVSFQSASLYCGLRIILVYLNP